MKRHVHALLVAPAVFSLGGVALAQMPPAIIVTAPGGGADSDDAAKLNADALNVPAGASLLRGLGAGSAALSFSEAQANADQPALVYRGFSASPLQGGAQGLAVYLDGGRFNLPFGDVVSLDLLPDNAIQSVTIHESNPVYGLNALGGALSLATHTGRSASGVSAIMGAGDHDRQEAQLSGGVAQGPFSLFVAGQIKRDAGWRDYSPSQLYNGFADIGWDAGYAGLHAKLLVADTKLTGNGTAPVELLARARDAVFTHPDKSRNQIARASLHPWVALDDTSHIEASLYAQGYWQKTLNGDLADIEGCEAQSLLLCLEGADDRVAPLRDTRGRGIVAFADVEAYGVFNRSRTRTTSGGFLVHYVQTAPVFGQDNALTLGLSHDWGRSRFAASTELGALGEDRGVTGLGPIIQQADAAIAPVSVHVRNRATGVFLANRMDLGDGLSAELGLRWNAVRIQLEDQIGTALNGDHSFYRLNPGMELDYRITDALVVNLGYAQTSRAPTAAELSCADEAAPCSLTNFFVADPPLDQVVAKSWSAGASGEWAVQGWRGDWRLSAYMADIGNDIQFTAANTRGRAYFRNLGKTRRAGLEAQFAAKQGPWSFNLAYALTSATTRVGYVATSPDHPAADEEGQIRVLPGSALPGIPRHRGVASLRYHLPSRGLTLRADAQAQSGLWRMGDDSNQAGRVEGFIRLDMGGSIAVIPGLAAFLDVTNIFNRRYATFGAFSETDEIDLPEAPGAVDPRADSPGAPRRFLLGVRVQL